MKTILVTGTSSGFGRMLVYELAKSRQYYVIAAMRNTAAQNNAVKKELEELPGVKVVELDVTSDEQVAKVVAQILEEFQSIDVLINNAGVFGGGLLEAHSIQQVHRLFEVNLYAPLRLMKAVLPSMRSQQDGLIINMSSMLGFFPSRSTQCIALQNLL